MSSETNGYFSHIVCAAKTDVGLKRSNNEDAFGTFPEAGVFCVADGMGGGDDGEIASAAVVKAVGDVAAKCTPTDAGGYAGADVVELLRSGLSGASDWICRRAEEKHLNGCGATFVGVVFDATNPAKAMAVHAGDSRLYRLRGKKIVQITRDHSAAELLGEKDERKLNPVFRSMVMNAVGVKHRVDAELTPFDVAKGDRVLICSDGLSRMVPDKKIASISVAHDDPDVALNALIDAALKAGGADNVTVVLLQVGELPPPAVAVSVPHVEDGADAATEGSVGETCPTLPPPPEPILPDAAAVPNAAEPADEASAVPEPADGDKAAESGGEKTAAAEAGGDEPAKAEADKPAAGKAPVVTARRHPPKGLVMLAVVMGTVAALALLFSLLRGDRPSSVAKGTAEALAPAVKKAMPQPAVRPRPEPPKSVGPKQGSGPKPDDGPKPDAGPKPDDGPKPGAEGGEKAMGIVPPPQAKPAVAAAVPVSQPAVDKPQAHPGADAFAKACAGKSLGEFVVALRRLSPQGRLLKEVEVFAKSGARLSVARDIRQLVRTAVDLHWALKAVADASPEWSDRFAPDELAAGAKADWRLIQNSERLDDGAPDDAVFAAVARLMAALPSVTLVGVIGREGAK